MPRTPRKKSSTGIYHVMLRGADRRIIFSDDEDCNRFLEAMKRAKKESEYLLYAWCLMGNHVHLLLKEEKEPLEISSNGLDQRMSIITTGSMNFTDTFFRTDLKVKRLRMTHISWMCCDISAKTR